VGAEEGYGVYVAGEWGWVGDAELGSFEGMEFGGFFDDAGVYGVLCGEQSCG